MIPQPWEFILLALGTYRLVRALGWDTFPPVERARDRLLGRSEGPAGPWFARPLLAELFACAFCLSFWTGLVLYLVWLPFPRAVLAACAVLGLSALAGLVAKNWDA